MGGAQRGQEGVQGWNPPHLTSFTHFLVFRLRERQRREQGGDAGSWVGQARRGGAGEQSGAPRPRPRPASSRLQDPRALTPAAPGAGRSSPGSRTGCGPSGSAPPLRSRPAPGAEGGRQPPRGSRAAGAALRAGCSGRRGTATRASSCRWPRPQPRPWAPLVPRTGRQRAVCTQAACGGGGHRAFRRPWHAAGHPSSHAGVGKLQPREARCPGPRREPGARGHEGWPRALTWRSRPAGAPPPPVPPPPAASPAGGLGPRSPGRPHCGCGSESGLPPARPPAAPSRPRTHLKKDTWAPYMLGLSCRAG